METQRTARQNDLITQRGVCIRGGEAYKHGDISQHVRWVDWIHCWLAASGSTSLLTACMMLLLLLLMLCLRGLLLMWV